LVRGPFGECSYQTDERDRPLILAGTGTGLAPLLGVLRDALASEHTGTITLFHGSERVAGLYLQKELAELARGLPSLSLVGSLLSLTPEEQALPEAWQLERAPLDQLVISRYPKLDAHRVFLCGSPALVHRLRKRAYLAGASLSRIHCDAFAAPHST
jgi:NAD(P)H-flavin reductase